MTAPSPGGRPAVTAGAPKGRSLRRRAEASVLRWEARLEGEAVDRWLPWGVALALAAVWLVLALARYRSLEAGTDLAAALQARWLILHGHAADVTVTGTHLLAQHLPIGFYPAAWLTRPLPGVGALLGLQAVALALGVVPLWRLARGPAALRVGAAGALVVAYAFSPTLNTLDLADFHPGAVAVAPLLWATLCVLLGRWRGFAVASVLAVAWSAELGLVVAGLGLLLLSRGEVRIGRRAMLIGTAWTVLAVVVLEPHFGSTGFIGPGAFQAYGDNVLTILGGMATHPGRLLGDLLGEDDLRLIVVLLAPLLFLPLLSPRYLLPALPLQVLYLVADAPKVGAEAGLPLVVFSFVAATFALGRMGRMGIERVAVDRRLVTALVIAALAFFATEASDSPYRRPWNWGREDAVDQARHDAADRLSHTAAVRASPSLLPLVAERTTVYPTADDLAGSDPGAGVDAVLLDLADRSLTTAEELRLGSRLSSEGFSLRFNQLGIRLYGRDGS